MQTPTEVKQHQACDFGFPATSASGVAGFGG